MQLSAQALHGAYTMQRIMLFSFLIESEKELPEGSSQNLIYTGMVLFSALSIVLSILSCCAWRYWKNFGATFGNSA